MLKAASLAVAFLKAVDAAQTSVADLNAFPEFAAAMTTAGGYAFRSYPVTTSSGYELMMFRIVGDEQGVDLVETKGPVMLMSGMFSDVFDWIKRTDEALPPIAVQLA